MIKNSYKTRRVTCPNLKGKGTQYKFGNKDWWSLLENLCGSSTELTFDQGQNLLEKEDFLIECGTSKSLNSGSSVFKYPDFQWNFEYVLVDQK